MADRPNILLLSADSLGANHLGCYGYHFATSPRIDALADEGVLCERVYCPGIPTFPSYTTLYTGQHPLTHGIVSHPCDSELALDAPSLPWLLLRDGYNTCAVDSLMRSRLWFGRGYEFYIDPSINHTLLHLATPCEELNARAIEWLQAYGRSSQPFFLFIHYWDTHWPYAPPQRYHSLFYDGDPYDPENHSLEPWWTHHPLGAAARNIWMRTPNGLITDADYVRALHDQEIRYLDDGISQMLEMLDRLGLAENTLVLLTGDHGESMTEHDIFFEHHGLYDTTLHVPLLARWPGRLAAGGRVSSMLQVSDIAPTLLEVGGLPIPDEMEGLSFWKQLIGEAALEGHDQVISLECYWEAKWSLRTQRHKLIVARNLDLYSRPRLELYDLMADPGELHNLHDQHPDLAAEMEATLEGWIANRMAALGLEEDPVAACVPKLSTLWNG